MSVQKFILIATVASFALFSCEKEEFTTTPNAPSVDQGTSTTIDDDVPSTLPTSNINRNIEDAEAILTPCGQSFYADVRIGNSVVTGAYFYEITKEGSNEIIDSGMIGHGEYTHPVLETCTSYTFTFFGGNSTAFSVSQTLSSDGCGGVFGC